MTREVRIYIEGGGDSRDGKGAIRKGFSAFLKPVLDLLRDRRVRLDLVACGSRNAAFDALSDAEKQHRDARCLLLVDAEHPVQDLEPWKHLHQKDGWPTEPSRNDRYHLMVITMESWLLADVDALARYYGKNFRRNALPEGQHVEALAKMDVERRLKQATEGTQKGAYHKIRHAPDLLARIDPARVRRAAPHCDRLFRVLEALASA